jgi:hypothetical protein
MNPTENANQPEKTEPPHTIDAVKVAVLGDAWERLLVDSDGPAYDDCAIIPAGASRMRKIIIAATQGLQPLSCFTPVLKRYVAGAKLEKFEKSSEETKFWNDLNAKGTNPLSRTTYRLKQDFGVVKRGLYEIFTRLKKRSDHNGLQDILEKLLDEGSNFVNESLDDGELKNCNFWVVYDDHVFGCPKKDGYFRKLAEQWTEIQHT